MAEAKCRCVDQIIAVPRKPFSLLLNENGGACFVLCTVEKMSDFACYLRNIRSVI